ncbi:hypothetical protein MMC30_003727 [Trapelia coarctata]|nr:hypothetical protein [Trapelia coarctata]
MSSSALTILHEMIQVFLGNPPQVAGEYLTLLEEAVDSRSQVVIDWPHFVANGVTIPPPRPDYRSRWSTGKDVTSLVLFLAPPRARLFSAQRFLQHSWTVETSHQTFLSTKLSAEYLRAKNSILNAQEPKTVVIAVRVEDLFDTINGGLSHPQASQSTAFQHSFTIGIGSEGVRIWQCWDHEFAFSLYGWQARGGTRVRSFEEMDAWMQKFDHLSQPSDTWSTELNDSYKHCFEVDFLAHCDIGNSYAPMASIYRSLIWMFTLPDVTFDDLAKFTWDAPGLRDKFTRQALREM